MPLSWQNCPVCGRSHSTITPGAPCSAQCSAEQRKNNALGTPKTADPRFDGGSTPKRGRSSGPGPVPKADDGCSLWLIGMVSLTALVVRLTARLIRK